MMDLSFRQRIAAGVLLGLLVVGGMLFWVTDPLRQAVEYRDELPGKNMYAHICGAVGKPGVVSVPIGSRVFEALKKAGGALPEADLEQVNLAAFVEDGQQIYLPKKGEMIVQPGYNGKTKGNSLRTGAKTHAVKPGKNGRMANAAPKLKVTWPLDLNQANQAQLELVPGIGPVMAGKILAYRQSIGQFTIYEDLKKVSGIGPAKLEKFRPYLCVK